jgi:DNA-binding LacI/PurR family transcriptional regulator
VVFGAGLTIGPEEVSLLRRSGTQAVIAWGGEQVTGAHWLRTDLAAVGAVAVEHLLERGRRRIGVVVPADATLGYFSRPRLAGAEQAAARFARRRKLRAAEAPRVTALELDYTEESAAALAEALPGLGLDAVFAYNDEYAMLLAAALRDAGLRIPEDLALVGADDLMLCRLLRPRLSSVRTELPGGRRLAELVDRLVRAADEPPVTVDLGAARMVARDSG